MVGELKKRTVRRSFSTGLKVVVLPFQVLDERVAVNLLKLDVLLLWLLLALELFGKRPVVDAVDVAVGNPQRAVVGVVATLDVDLVAGDGHAVRRQDGVHERADVRVVRRRPEPVFRERLAVDLNNHAVVLLGQPC